MAGGVRLYDAMILMATVLTLELAIMGLVFILILFFWELVTHGSSFVFIVFALFQVMAIILFQSGSTHYKYCCLEYFLIDFPQTTHHIHQQKHLTGLLFSTEDILRIYGATVTAQEFLAECILQYIHLRTTVCSKEKVKLLQRPGSHIGAQNQL